MLKQLMNNLNLDAFSSIERYTLENGVITIEFNPRHSDAFTLRDALNIIDNIDKEQYTYAYLDGAIQITLKS